MISLIIFVLALSNVNCRREIPRDLIGLTEYSASFDPFKRFPQFVTISRTNVISDRNCSGSIIADRWILTTLSCVRSEKFSVYFLMDDIKSPGYFSLSLDPTFVVPYPTGFDNIALVRLPLALPFSDRMSSIKYSSEDQKDLDNVFAVMPGYNAQEPGQKLFYEMLKILPSQTCQQRVGEFDSFWDLCAEDWVGEEKVWTTQNEGSGLITGWPRSPKLVGILDKSDSFDWKTTAEFLKVSAYSEWISQTIWRGN